MTLGKFLREAAIAALDAVEEQQCLDRCGSTAKTSRGEVDATIDELDDGANIPLSSCDGNKKSLFIGINYFGTRAELRGCINDVKNIRAFVVKHFNFPTDAAHMKVLIDSDKSNMPTKANILQVLQWLKAGAQPGDSLFLHYSGHGGSQEDTNGDEVDGKDETLIPVDYQKAGVIVDDDLHEILVAGLPAGVRLTAIMDCCHSGSVLDLPFTYAPNGKLEIQEIDNRKAAAEAALHAGKSLLMGDKQSALLSGVKAISLYIAEPQQHNEEARKKQIAIRSTVADVVQFSGCRDEQTSADAKIGGEATGAMSWSFRQAFAENGFDQTYAELLGNIRKLLYGKYTQVPQMSAGHRMDVRTKFTM